MIPRIIHYCWFGQGAFSDEIKLCIASWKKFCPDYEIKCWDESNSPMNVPWVKDAFKHRKYAFMADYVRFYALYNEGGVYMDTDMLLVKNIDIFLNEVFFLGLEDKFNASMGIIGSEIQFDFNKVCLDYYDSTKFDMLHPPIITRFITPLLHELGLKEDNISQQLNNGIMVYSSDFFYPIHYNTEFNLNQISSFCTVNTFGVHLWNKSWTTEFILFEEGKYIEGFKMTRNRLMHTPCLPFGYYKKLVKYITKYVFKNLHL